MEWTNECALAMRKYRAENRITQKEFSDKIGISQSCICEMERGSCKFVRMYHAKKLCETIPGLKEIEKRQIEEIQIHKIDSKEHQKDYFTEMLQTFVNELVRDIMSREIDSNVKVDLYNIVTSKLETFDVKQFQNKQRTR